VENSTFLITIEEKIPFQTYLKWEEEKDRIKRNHESVNIEKFIDFYTDKIRREENAQYLRPNKGQPETSGSHKKPQKALILQTTFQQRKPPQTRQFQKPEWKKFNKNKTQHPNWSKPKQYQQEKPTWKTKKVQFQNTNKNRYCIFCEINGHSTAWCRSLKHTAKFKEEKVRKHNCCYMCLMPTQHRVDTCPFRKQCLICSKIHHFNNHPRQEINEYYKKREQNPKRK